MFYFLKFLSLFILIFSPFLVLASSPLPTPICHVSGVIEAVDFREAYDEPCFSEPSGCPTDIEINHPARYYLEIKVNSTSYARGETYAETCDSLYPIGQTSRIFVNQAQVKTGDIFAVGQKIQGQARSLWGKTFDTYSLLVEKEEANKNDGYLIVEEKIGEDRPVIKKEELTDKLLENKQIDPLAKINEISFRPDGPTYEVIATKAGKLFFFIPVNLDIYLTIDAVSGQTLKMKKPWWSFLVKP